MEERLRQDRVQSVSLFGLLVLFIVLSIAFLVPSYSSEHDAGNIASELLVKETTDSSFIRQDYVDADGNIVYAIDKHYASLIKQIDSNGMIEKELFLNVDKDIVAGQN